MAVCCQGQGLRVLFYDDWPDRANLGKLSLKNPWHLLALGFGPGKCPFAPGTFGSIASLPVCMVLVYQHLAVQLLVIVLFSAVAWAAVHHTERDMGEHDNPHIVADEWAGMFISCLAYPREWYLTLLALVLFRFFDILKPYPVSYIDRRVPGAAGTMLDDMAAGVLALVCGHFILTLSYGFYLLDHYG